MKTIKKFRLEIDGLGIVFFSPFAVADIGEGEDFLAANLWQPEDVAPLVNSCRFVVLATGTPGDFIIHALTGPLDEGAVTRAEFKVRVCLEVRDGEVHFRDLYDFSQWTSEIPNESRLPMENGFYRITAYSSTPNSGVLGQDQDVFIHFDRTVDRPSIRHEGMPQLCPEDDD